MTDVVVRRTERLKGEVCAPPSKAYTQRMLIAAALSSGTSKISGPLLSDDTEATLRAVKALGTKVNVAEDCWTVEGVMPLKGAKAPIDCGESGATLRFMIPVAALALEPSVFLLGHSLEQRPIDPLLQSLKQLGVEAHSQRLGDKASVLVKGGGILGGKTAMRGDVSSQFVSGLMFACPMARADTEITLTTPLESKGYVQMTKAVLAEHGIQVFISEDFGQPAHSLKSNVQAVRPQGAWRFFVSRVPLGCCSHNPLGSDASRILIMRLCRETRRYLSILKRMGVKGRVCRDHVEIDGKGGLLEAVDVDARNIPDLVPVCAVLACYAKGTSKIHDAHRLRYKESDRLLSLYLELRKMGAQDSHG